MKCDTLPNDTLAIILLWFFLHPVRETRTYKLLSFLGI